MIIIHKRLYIIIMFFSSFFDIIHKESFLRRGHFGGLRPLFQDFAVIVHNPWFVTWQKQTNRTLNKYKYCDRNVQINTNHRGHQKKTNCLQFDKSQKIFGFFRKMWYSGSQYEPGVRFHVRKIHSDGKCPPNRHFRG